MTAAAEQRARSLLAETRLFDELGLGQLAGSCRVVAQHLLDTLDELEAERSARRALQGRCEQQQEILGRAVYQACVEAVGR